MGRKTPEFRMEQAAVASRPPLFPGATPQLCLLEWLSWKSSVEGSLVYLFSSPLRVRTGPRARIKPRARPGSDAERDPESETPQKPPFGPPRCCQGSRARGHRASSLCNPLCHAPFSPLQQKQAFRTSNVISRYYQF